MPVVERPWLKHYDPGVPADITHEPFPLFQMLEDAAAKHPDRVCTVFFNRERTYREINGLANEFAAFLKGLGVGKGDRVALLLPNVPQFIYAYYGALKLGAIVVPCNPMYVERELAFQLKDSGARTIVTLDMFYPTVRAVREEAGLEHIIVTTVAEELSGVLKLLFPLRMRLQGNAVKVPREEGVYFTSEVLKGIDPGPPEVEIDPLEDLALLQYTGGTTGTPKGAMLTHWNLAVNTIQSTLWMIADQPDGHERMLAVLPFFHVYGMTVVLNLGLYVAATVILLPRFEIEQVIATIQRHKPTLFPGAPTMYVGIINHPKARNYDLSSIKACISGSAPLPVEVQRRFEELTRGKLVEGYGLTEASPVTHCNPIYGKRVEGSIGLAFPSTYAKIVDLETGEKELPPGEIGELAVKGPQVMKGYWNRPEETEAVLRGEWLLTGDIAKMDEEGWVYILDRKKDMIIAGGFNIYPREVEEVLYTHPKVQEAAVVGVPDEYRGETVKAYVVLKEGETATAEEIISYCREHLARYKVPRLVEFRDELPKTFVGKVLRRVLAEEEKRAQREA